MFYKLFVRPALFQLSRHDPEIAHDWALTTLKGAGRKDVARNALTRLTRVEDERLSQTLFGLRFPNPIGLAAGFDHNAEAIHGLAALGFGFLEVGTVTQHEQPGSDRPRVVRYPRERALINRMGFPNVGAAMVRNRIVRLGKPQGVPLGISIGKSAVTPLDQAVGDYVFSFQALYEVADYFVVNVSSPNTPGLRRLQEKERFRELLIALQQANRSLGSGRPLKPILVKLSPDVTYPQIVDALGVCFDTSVAGVVAVNTSVVRSRQHEHLTEEGGLSGKPLFRRSLDVVRFIRREAGSRMPIIGVGGIFSARDAYYMMTMGANLVQIYTSLVYEGPFVVKKMNRGLLRLLRKEGLQNFAQVNPITQY